MKLRALTYRSFAHGQVGIDLETGGLEASLSFSVRELFKFYLHLRKLQPVHILNVKHAEFLEEDRAEVAEAFQVFRESGLPVWSESDGENMPAWLSLASRRTVHITSQPWYQYATNEIVFHMDEAMEPQIDATHAQRGSIFYIHLGSKADVQRAVVFMRTHPGWLLKVPPRFEILMDLAVLDVEKLSEDL